jgi:GDP-L-fucose synthase
MLAHLESSKQQYGLEFSYAILTNLYGPGDRFDVEYGHVIPSLIAKFYAAARNGSSLDVWGSGIAKRDFLYSDDAAKALVAIGQEGKGTYNVATGRTVPIRRVVEILMDVSGVRSVRWDQTKPDGQLDRSYDTSKLKDLNFLPDYSLERGLENTYKWYCDNYPNVRV